MSTVELTQYMRPHGRRETVRCEVPDEIATLAAPREQHPDKRLIALIERVSKRRERGATGGEG